MTNIIETGVVTSVDSRSVGSPVVGDAVAGDFTLFVNDNVDFSPGDLVLITPLDTEMGDYYTVGAVDDEAGITLTTALSDAQPAGSWVAITPPQSETIAMVRLAQSGEVQPCVVLHTLTDALRLGIRDETTAETVLTVLAGDTRYVFDIIARQPVRDVSTAIVGDGGTPIAQLDLDLTNLNDVVLPQVQADLAENALLVSGLQGLFPITSTSISDGAITTPKMTANSINGDRIAANTLNADKIVANSITGDKIAANSISADKIVANSIGAAQLTGDAIDGKTITGATVRTTSTANRGITVDTSGVRGWDGSGDLAFYFDAATGVCRFYRGFTVFDEDVYVGGTFQVLGQVAGLLDMGGHSVTNAFNVLASNLVSAETLRQTTPGSTGSAANVFMNGSGDLVKSTSSQRYKTNIVDAEIDVAAVLALRPRTFTRPGDDDPDHVYLGVIAEEVHDLGLHQLVQYDDEDRPDGIDWWALSIAQQAVLQRQQGQIDDLIARLAEAGL